MPGERLYQIRFEVVVSLKRHMQCNGNIENLVSVTRLDRPYVRNWALIVEPEKSDAMFEIAAAVCMVGSAQNCREIVLSFEADNVTPVSCMMYGQT